MISTGFHHPKQRLKIEIAETNTQSSLHPLSLLHRPRPTEVPPDCRGSLRVGGASPSRLTEAGAGPEEPRNAQREPHDENETNKPQDSESRPAHLTGEMQLTLLSAY